MYNEIPQKEGVLIIEGLNNVYREIAEVIGSVEAEEIWHLYHGQTIVFPQKLYSRKAVKGYIQENMKTMTPKELARKVGLTDRRVRQIINEIESSI